MRKVNPIVSVIVPICKVEKYLQQCIDSICTQTYPQLEIILVDDGSPDNCGKICDFNATIDSRIKVIHKKNGGLSSARNTGLDIAKGEFISFVDADDTIYPQFIEILVGLCEQYDCDVAQCDYLAVREDSLKLPLNPEHLIRFYNYRQAIHELCSGNDGVKYSVAWNKVYRKKLFDNIRYPLSRFHEDEFTTYLLLWKSQKIAVTNQYLYYYLQRTTSITGKPFSISRLDALDALRERATFLEQNKLQSEYFDTLRTMLWLIGKDYILLKKHVSGSDDICAKLLEEKEKIEKLLPEKSEKDVSMILSHDQIKKDCQYPINSKIVLYGAGNWGKIYYQWINENHYGTVVGWVDNRWYALKDIDYPVSPLDSLLRITFDYILITIKSKSIQEEVVENLVSWGISKEKILLSSSD